METLHTGDIVTMIGRTLNLIDNRLVDHGARVALVLEDLLRAEGCRDPELRKDLHILALLHDVGAYRTEEISNMVKFEIGNAWEHSIYGYLFLREFTPLKERAEVVLYHHADCASLPKGPEEVRHYAQLLHIADRAVIWHDEVKGTKDALAGHLRRKAGSAFLPECVELFWDADRRFGTMAKLDAPVHIGEIMRDDALSVKEARDYLEMVVHTIDFRSHVTVTHTMSVMEIGVRLARRMGLPEQTREQIYYGALLHDLGKVGTPLSILEKPGRLTDEEMAVMREHVVLSAQIIDGCVEEAVARIAVRHHEKLDGSGYPLGLSGEELTLPERILAVADIVSALCMRRSYKDEFPKERCLNILREWSGQGKLDPQVVGTVETYYGEIVEEAGAACEPVREVYERLTGEYHALLEAHR